MVRYIRSNDYESGAEYAFAYAPHIFGYKFFSTMTGTTIMFCNENQNYLHRHIKTIYDFLMNDEDGAEKYQDYCAENDIVIVDDEYGDLIVDDDMYIAEIDGEQYLVDVIASDRGRF